MAAGFHTWINSSVIKLWGQLIIQVDSGKAAGPLEWKPVHTDYMLIRLNTTDPESYHLNNDGERQLQ